MGTRMTASQDDWEGRCYVGRACELQRGCQLVLGGERDLLGQRTEQRLPCLILPTVRGRGGYSPIIQMKE